RAALRGGRQRYLNYLSSTKAGERVGETRARPGGVLVFDDVGLRLDRGAVDGQQKVATFDSGAVTGRPGGHLDGRDALGPRSPENAVFNLTPFGVGDDVRDAKPGETKRNDEGEDIPTPCPPTGLRQLRSPGRI